MKLSIIIPTRNRAEVLKKALESLISQTFPQPNFEVLIIDNASSDNTEIIVKCFQEKILNLHYYYESNPGLHIGRHKGLFAANSDILVYADDDIEAFPTWLEEIYNTFQDPKVVLVGGKNLPKFESEPPEWILKLWDKKIQGNQIVGALSIIDLGDEIKGINPYHVFGCNFSIRKEIVFKAGGFHPDGMPQELIKYRGDGESHVSKYVLDNKLIAKYNPKASVYHLVSNNRMTNSYFCQRAYNQGISDSYTNIRNGFNLLRCICILVNRIKTFNPFDKIAKSYYNGYKYHKECCKKDSSILEWVKKDNYFNEKGDINDRANNPQ